MFTKVKKNPQQQQTLEERKNPIEIGADEKAKVRSRTDGGIQKDNKRESKAENYSKSQLIKDKREQEENSSQLAKTSGTKTIGSQKTNKVDDKLPERRSQVTREAINENGQKENKMEEKKLPSKITRPQTDQVSERKDLVSNRSITENPKNLSQNESSRNQTVGAQDGDLTTNADGVFETRF